MIAAVSGMRASELMELQVGCRLPPEESGPGIVCAASPVFGADGAVLAGLTGCGVSIPTVPLD